MQYSELTLLSNLIMSELLSISANAFQPFSFTVATILRGSKKFRGRTKEDWIIQRQEQSAYQFHESLGHGIELAMVAISGNSFLMGSPGDEPEQFEGEGAQHVVNVPPFFMGRYPITQAQWMAVARMPKVERELIEDRLVQMFRGDNRPAAFVYWHEAVEFCNRLTNYTKHPYRLPSEAEWGYACRAGTKSPFHFGATISTELARYDGDFAYNYGPKGEFYSGSTPSYRRGTTAVDFYKNANDFGLSDMHGNVGEWCADHWHENYENAPTDGSAWLSENLEENMYCEVVAMESTQGLVDLHSVMGLSPTLAIMESVLGYVAHYFQLIIQLFEIEFTQ